MDSVGLLSATGRQHSALAFRGLPWDRLIHALPMGVYTCDIAGRLVQYNAKAAELWGRAPDLDKTDYRFCGGYKAYRLTGEPIDMATGPVAQVLKTGKPMRAKEAILERPDGSRIFVQADSEPLHDEEGKLVGAINCFQDISARKSAEADSLERDRALAENEHRLHELLQTLPAAVYTTDLEGRITFYNDAAVAFAGRRPSIGEKWCVTWRLYRPDGSYLPHDQCPMAVTLKEGRAVRGAEAIAERPDGSRVWFTPYPTPLTDPQGRMVGAVNMLVDITARKQAEQQQKLLVDEVNHRAKNTLATVQSLIAQTMRPDIDDFRRTLQARVQALSRAQDQLSRRNWNDADFGEVVRAGLAPYLADGRIALAGEKVRLPPRAALLLSMAFHELGTNAQRHGALSQPGGSVDLRWHVDGQILHVQWHEHGGPPVRVPAHPGFGTRVIERGIEAELRGRAVIEFAPSGVRCAIDIPLRHGDE
jgi:PAS domain S-box-containing protein